MVVFFCIVSFLWFWVSLLRKKEVLDPCEDLRFFCAVATPLPARKISKLPLPRSVPKTCFSWLTMRSVNNLMSALVRTRKSQIEPTYALAIVRS